MLVSRKNQLLLLLIFCIALTACSGGNDSTSPPNPTSNPTPTPSLEPSFVLGVDVQDIVSGGKLVLVLNTDITAEQTLTVMQNGQFNFTQRLNIGENYTLSVAVQPVAQNCTLQSASGVISPNNNEIQVRCTVTQSFPLEVEIVGTKRLLHLDLVVGKDSDPQVLELDPLSTSTAIVALADIAYGTPYKASLSGDVPGSYCVIEGSAEGKIENQGSRFKVLCHPSDLIQDAAIEDTQLKICITNYTAAKGWTKLTEVVDLVCNAVENSVEEKVASLKGVGVFVNLQKLSLQYQNVADITPILNLHHLEELNVLNNPIVNADKLVILKKLKRVITFQGGGSAPGNDVFFGDTVSSELDGPYVYYDQFTNEVYVRLKSEHENDFDNSCHVDIKLVDRNFDLSIYAQSIEIYSCNIESFEQVPLTKIPDTELINGDTYELQMTYQLTSEQTGFSKIAPFSYKVRYFEFDSSLNIDDIASLGENSEKVKNCIVEQLNNSGNTTEEITTLNLTTGCISEEDVVDLSFLMALYNLQTLNFGNFHATNIHILNDLVKLNLISSKLSTITFDLQVDQLENFITDENLQSCIIESAVEFNAQTNQDLTELNCSGQSIISVAGLEYFPALQRLTAMNETTGNLLAPVTEITLTNNELAKCLADQASDNNWIFGFQISALDCSSDDYFITELGNIASLPNLKQIQLPANGNAEITAPENSPELELIPFRGYSITFPSENSDWDYSVELSLTDSLIFHKPGDPANLLLEYSYISTNNAVTCNIELTLTDNNGEVLVPAMITDLSSCNGSETMAIPTQDLPTSGSYVLEAEFNIEHINGVEPITASFDIFIKTLDATYEFVGDIFSVGAVDNPALEKCIGSEAETSIFEITEIDFTRCHIDDNEGLNLDGLQYLPMLSRIQFAQMRYENFQLLDKLPLLSWSEFDPSTIVIDLQNDALDPYFSDTQLQKCIRRTAQEESLRYNHELHELECSEEYISSLHGLKFLPAINSLDLSRQPINDSQVQTLEEHQNLCELYSRLNLTYTDISVQAVVGLDTFVSQHCPASL